MKDSLLNSEKLHRLAPPPPTRRVAAPPAQSLGTPLDFRRGPGQAADAVPPEQSQTPATDSEQQAPGPRKQATETLAQRAGALSDEVDFPEFVASLVHGTFDAIVDASIRQMESYADLVSAVAKSADQFTEDSVTLNQARDWLAQQYPQDLRLDLTGSPKLFPVPGEDGESRSPGWLKEFGLEGEELTPDFIEETLIPLARKRVGQGRQQTLATMVLMGLNRVVVRDGSISARLNLRAVAADTAKVEYAVSSDPGGESNWGQRGSATYALPSTKVSTVNVNVQADSQLAATLVGEVKINFASETVPLDRLVDEARRTLLERRAKPVSAPTATAPAPAAPSAPPATADNKGAAP